MALSSSSSPPLLPFDLQRHRLVSLKPYTRSRSSQSQHTVTVNVTAAKAKASSATPLVYSTRQGFDTVNIAEDVTQVLYYLLPFTSQLGEQSLMKKKKKLQPASSFAYV